MIELKLQYENHAMPMADKFAWWIFCKLNKNLFRICNNNDSFVGNNDIANDALFWLSSFCPIFLWVLHCTLFIWYVTLFVQFNNRLTIQRILEFCFQRILVSFFCLCVCALNILKWSGVWFELKIAHVFCVLEKFHLNYSRIFFAIRIDHYLIYYSLIEFFKQIIIL